MMFSAEIEQAILGSAMLNPEAVHLANVRPEHFHDAVHAEIFSTMLERVSRNELISPPVMASLLGDREGLKQLGGGKYLVRLAGAATGVTTAEGYGKELRRMARRRDLEALLSDGLQSLKDGAEPDAIVGAIEAASTTTESEDRVSMAQAAMKAAEMADAARKGDGPPGITTGLADLDHMTGGFNGGELILLGGRPSMGKTAVALHMALAAARKGHGVAIASLEMTPQALALRAMTNEAASRGKSLAYVDARRGTMDDTQARHLFEAGPAIANLPIEILPPTVRDVGALYAGVKKSARILAAKGKPLRLVVVDYLQLLSGSARDRFALIAEISIALKGLAMRLNVPVLALSQLSRAVESRENKRPVLSDLRESGQLEQDADSVIFCYRHEYYVEREKPEIRDTEAMADWSATMDAVRSKLELILAKQRMGPIGTAHVHFDAASNYLWNAA